MTEIQQMLKDGMGGWLANGYATGTLTAADLEKSIHIYLNLGEGETENANPTE